MAGQASKGTSMKAGVKPMGVGLMWVVALGGYLGGVLTGTLVTVAAAIVTVIAYNPAGLWRLLPGNERSGAHLNYGLFAAVLVLMGLALFALPAQEGRPALQATRSQSSPVQVIAAPILTARTQERPKEEYAALGRYMREVYVIEDFPLRGDATSVEEARKAIFEFWGSRWFTEVAALENAGVDPWSAVPVCVAINAFSVLKYKAAETEAPLRVIAYDKYLAGVILSLTKERKRILGDAQLLGTASNGYFFFDAHRCYQRTQRELTQRGL